MHKKKYKMKPVKKELAKPKMVIKTLEHKIKVAKHKIMVLNKHKKKELIKLKKKK